MVKYRNLLFYITTIGGFCLLMYFIVLAGNPMEVGKVTHFAAKSSNWKQFENTFLHNLTHPLTILLLQIVTIIIVVKVFSYLCKKMRQPTVVGEIAAGIFLGPSFIGYYFPAVTEVLFPASSMGNLQFLSQIGLILFMFVIGMELDLKVLKNKAHEAIVVSHASIVVPFALGMLLALLIYPVFAPRDVPFLPFSLFIGISMSITAFPVLARIVQERGLNKTRIGSLVITCAAADDITAWCLLAAVIAIVKAGSIVSSLYTIFMAIIYVALMLKVVQPFLKRLGDVYSNKEGLSKPVVAIFFIVLLVSSYTTEIIGIHALFGAFMAGVIMPSNLNFRNIFIEKIEDVSVVLLLPLFFVFTGLRTQIGLLNDLALWKICGIIIIVAVTGKFLGSALAARFVGQRWRESLIIGALMNTRGLMELVVLNIGYDLGVLSPEIFAMMVLMALITTLMTGPALDIINWALPEKLTIIPPELDDVRKFKILVSFGNTERGKSMVKLAHSLTAKTRANSSITALHMAPSSELNQFNTEEYEQDSFLPIKEEAQKLSMPLTTLFKPSQNLVKEIAETANIGHFDLMIIGIGHSIFEGTLLGKILGFTTKFISPERIIDTLTGKEKLFENTIFDETTKQIIRQSKVPVGILVDKGLEKVQTVFVPVFSINDSFLFLYVQKLIQNAQARIIVMDNAGVIRQHPELKETIRSIEHTAPNHIALYAENKLDKDFLSQQDLMLISIESWKKLIETKSVWLTNTPSVLILKN